MPTKYEEGKTEVADWLAPLLNYSHLALISNIGRRVNSKPSEMDISF
jgi:hypothetical protein